MTGRADADTAESEIWARRTPSSVRERDLDNFLIEELSASPSFRSWFLRRLLPCFDVPPYAEVRVGKNPRREIEIGQTDLSCAFLNSSGTQLALLLVESKVASGFQLDQPERYQREVEVARERLGPARAAAVLVAPALNVPVLDHRAFDVSIRIEQIVEHLRARISGELARADGMFADELRFRLQARVDLLEALAGKRSYGQWTPNPIPERVGFMQQYRQLAGELAPGLKLTVSTGGKQATSVLFTGLRTTGVHAASVRHDFGKTQRVSIVFPNAGAARTKITASGMLPKGATVEATKNGSLIVRLDIKRITPIAGDFERQRDRIADAVQKVLLLESWAAENAPKLASLFGTPSSSRV